MPNQNNPKQETNSFFDHDVLGMYAELTPSNDGAGPAARANTVAMGRGTVVWVKVNQGLVYFGVLFEDTGVLREHLARQWKLFSGE